MIFLIASVIFVIIAGSAIFGIWNQHRLIKRNHAKEEEEYMKKHPDSYGIGEIKW